MFTDFIFKIMKKKNVRFYIYIRICTNFSLLLLLFRSAIIIFSSLHTFQACSTLRFTCIRITWKYACILSLSSFSCVTKTWLMFFYFLLLFFSPLSGRFTDVIVAYRVHQVCDGCIGPRGSIRVTRQMILLCIG